jgi:hypothetical protein
MVLASRQEKPAALAASVQPPILPVYARTMMAMVKPQTMPMGSHKMDVSAMRMLHTAVEKAKV